MQDAHESPRTDFIFARWLFLRLLGLIYLIAFASLWSQIHGLVGSDGILPAQEYLDAAKGQLGREAYLQLPTVCWLGCSDAMLTSLCLAGIVASVVLIVGFAPLPTLVVLWTAYLSLSLVGQTFLSFQWDTLLLETGFFAVFFAPWTFKPGLARERRVDRIDRWLLWWLLFKLMFLSGATKLLSGDPTWRDLTAMHYHYQTQPIPNPLSWYVHQLPGWWQKTTVIVTFIIELIVPLFIFAPRRLRHAACFLMIGLQLVIEATGNFGFFNLLTIVLCVPLLDDRLLCRFVPDRPLQTNSLDSGIEATPRHAAVLVVVSLLLLASVLAFVREMVRTARPAKLPGVVNGILNLGDRCLLSWGEPHVLRWTDPFRTINGYGLFRVMTTERPEIVIEASDDGLHWQEVPFRFKPGDVKRPPPVVAPHQPRLDWQMWFAALNPDRAKHWLSAFLERVLEGSPDVAALLADSDFGRRPPRYVRLVYYRYEFTRKGAANDAWWQRTRLETISQPISLPVDARLHRQ